MMSLQKYINKIKSMTEGNQKEREQFQKKVFSVSRVTQETEDPGSSLTHY